jgi:hypothetical protein
MKSKKKTTATNKEIGMKRIAFSVLAGLSIMLSACSATSTKSILPGTTKTNGNGLSTETELAIGTLRLKDTEYEITAEQAKDLLVYWYVYQDISDSSATAQEEVDGLVDQIQETMTSDQIQAIKAMNLSQQDISSAGQKTAATTKMSSTSNTGGMGGPGDGGPPDGGGGGMGGGPMGGGSPDMGGGGAPTGSNSTQKTTGINSNNSSDVPSSVVTELIKYLQEKVAA